MLKNQRGAVLVAVIITMMIFASLGAMMLSFFTTSTFSQLGGSRGMQAYYIAESGFRYAASQYLNAADAAARQTLLESMHNKTFNLTSGGKFNLQVYPYWYETTALPVGTNLEAKVYGGLPLEAGQYKLGSSIAVMKPDGSTRYEQISGATLTPPSGITFTKTVDWLEAYPVGSIIYPVARATGTGDITVTVNDPTSYISLQSESGYDIFPPRNGMVAVRQTNNNTRLLTYDEVYEDAGTYKLRGIRDPKIATTETVTIAGDADGAPIVLAKALRLKSTGILSEGSNIESKRVVTYLVPIGYTGTVATTTTPEYHPQWSNLAHDWFIPLSGGYEPTRHASYLGTQMVTEVPGEGGYALLMYSGYAPDLDKTFDQVSDAMDNMCCNSKLGTYNVPITENMLGLNWSAAGVRFDQEWERAGYFLSYDVQVKMYIDPTGFPSGMYDEYSAGLLFRVDRDGDCYGLSFSHADKKDDFFAIGCDGYGQCDGIPRFIPNPNDPNPASNAYANAEKKYTPRLTLWRKQYNYNFTFTVKDDYYGRYTDRGGPDYLCCNSTAGSDPPTGGNLLSPPTDPANSYYVPESAGRHSMAIVTYDSVNTFNNGYRVRFRSTGTLPAPLQPDRDYYVRYAYMVEKGSLDDHYFLVFDTEEHALKLTQGSPPTNCWEGLVKITDAGSGTHTVIGLGKVDAGDPITPTLNPSYWQNIARKYTREPPTSQKDWLHLSPKTSSTDVRMRKWITVLARVKEAPSVTFQNGGGTSKQRISVGDVVYQGTEASPTATARVSREPVYQNPTSYKAWSSGTAKGALILDVIKNENGSIKPYTFSTGNLYVVGKGTTSLASVTEFKAKSNWVQAFVADPDDQTQAPVLQASNTIPWDPKFEATADYNTYRKAVTRGSIYWPPGDVTLDGATQITADNDYFTLVKWEVTDMYPTSGTKYTVGFWSETNNTTGKPDMLRLHEEVASACPSCPPVAVPLRTPNSGTFPTNRPEVGLSAYGHEAMGKTYFDDFAIRMETSTTQTPVRSFMQALQY